MEYWEQLQTIRKKIKEIYGVIRVYKEGNVYRIKVMECDAETVKIDINRKLSKELSFNRKTEKYYNMVYLYYDIIIPKTGIDLEIEELEQKLKDAKNRKKELTEKKKREERRKQLEAELKELEEYENG